MKVDPIASLASSSPRADTPRGKNESVDITTFWPFILIDGDFKVLVLFDSHFEEKAHIFKERAEEGWTGNGCDWNAVAQAVIAERFPQLANEVIFESNTNLFLISGTTTSLTVLGHALKIVFDDDHILRDILFRAKLQH
ncbi:Immunity protein 51 [Collimonas sp. OK607]|nr:Immunity protein 51 [Collimonas sp. OK607]